MSIFNENDRKTAKLKKIAKKVLAKEQEYAAMSDEALAGMTALFKSKLAEGAKLDDLLVDAYATVRETSSRVLNMKHFPVQIMGGIALHQGRIAEMATGEGKTLVATLPAYLNALAGKGVHIVTVNDYLAKRDAEWMENIYRFLGMSVGVILHGMSREEKQKAYRADITYCSNSELGFDFLRDNMAVRAEDIMQRDFNFAIIDEVDSILIDEARTPLIISNVPEVPTDDLIKVAKFAEQCTEATPVLDKEKGSPLLDGLGNEVLQGDCEVDYEKHTAILTEEGLKKAEEFFGTSSFFGKGDGEADGTGEIEDAGDAELYNRIGAALKAKFLFLRDRDYLVDAKKRVVIIDHNTGRAMPGRRFNDGLHQAIEAKEALKDKGVKILGDNKIAATITYQNLFRQYRRISGMTGTAKTEEAEFKDIYKLDVVKIPTNLPCARESLYDKIFITKEAKMKALIDDIAQRHAAGQPLLIGTTSVEESEEVSDMLVKRGIEHEVLNAKNNKNEAFIVAQAGAYGAVTISTNMAGRGTDILLGGNPEYKARKEIEEIIDAEYKENFVKSILGDEAQSAEREGGKFSAEAQSEYAAFLEERKQAALIAYEAVVSEVLDRITAKFPIAARAEEDKSAHGMNIAEISARLKPEYEKYLADAKKESAEQKAKVIAAGGLCVIGTGRNESRRIDDQLSGRAGRQGDKGQCEFYISLEDDILRYYNNDRLKKLLSYLLLRIPAEEMEKPIQLKVLNKFILNTQKKIEGVHFVARRDLLYYDEVLEIQRKDIYSERRDILLSRKDIHAQILEMFEKLAQSIVEKYVNPSEGYDKWDIEGLTEELERRMLEPAEAPSESKAEDDEFDEEYDDEREDVEDEEDEEQAELEHEDDEDYEDDDEEPESKEHNFKPGSVITLELCETGDPSAIVNAIVEEAEKEYGKKVDFYKAKGFDYADEERFVLQTNIDRYWPDFLDKNNSLRESVRLRAYGQHDPRIVFRKESMEMFDKLLDKIYLGTAEILLKASVPRRFYAINMRDAGEKVMQLDAEIKKLFTSPEDWQPSEDTLIKQSGRDEFLMSLAEERSKELVEMSKTADGKFDLVKLDKLADVNLFVRPGNNAAQTKARPGASEEELAALIKDEACKQIRAELATLRRNGEKRVDGIIAALMKNYIVFAWNRSRAILQHKNSLVKLDSEQVDAFLKDCEQLYEFFFRQFTGVCMTYLFKQLDMELRARQGKKVSGVVRVIASQTPGRNDPCPCGSGKKYKNCCGRTATGQIGSQNGKRSNK